MGKQDPHDGEPPAPFGDRVRAVCPRCRSTETTLTVLGLPARDAVDAAPPWIGFGGCTIPIVPEPDWHCTSCGFAWFSDPAG